jgi:hypothetical protein
MDSSPRRSGMIHVPLDGGRRGVFRCFDNKTTLVNNDKHGWWLKATETGQNYKEGIFLLAGTPPGVPDLTI